MTALLAIWHAITAVALTTDYTTLGVAAVIALLAGLVLQSVKDILSITVVALIVFALAKIVLALVLTPHPDVHAVLAGQWKTFVDLKMLTLIAYALMFFAVIAVVNAIRAAVR